MSKKEKVESTAVVAQSEGRVVEQMRDQMFSRMEEVKRELGEAYDLNDQLAKVRLNDYQTMAHAYGMSYLMVENGMRLSAIRAAEGDGGYLEALVRIGFTSQRASECIRIYENFDQSPALPDILAAGPTKLIEFMRLPEDKQEELKAEGTIDGVPAMDFTKNQLRKMVKDGREETEQLKAELQKAKDDAKKTGKELEQVYGDLEAAKKGRTVDDDRALVEARVCYDLVCEVKARMASLQGTEYLTDDTLAQLIALTDFIGATGVSLAKIIDEATGYLQRTGNELPDAAILNAEKADAAIKTMRFTGDSAAQAE